MDIDTRKVGGVHEPTSIDMDPYSEYVHPQQQQTTETFRQIVDAPTQTEKHEDEYVPLQGVAALNRHIDDFFDGVDLFFNLSDRIIDRIGGPNARRRKNIK